MTIKHLFFICFLVLLASCYRSPEKIEPTLSGMVQQQYLESLPSPFSPLSSSEQREPWGIEYQIGLGFAHRLDLYPSITSFKRAEILIPPDHTRLMEIEYDIILCYYLGARYQSVVDTFEHSSLQHSGKQFTTSHDLLVILYDSYSQVKNEEKAARTLQLLQTWYPETAKKLETATALLHADFAALFSYEDPVIQQFLTSYGAGKKSVGKAQLFNALFPGAGYFYLGQMQSGITALLLNGSFIAAATHFFMHHNFGAGMIFTSFEAGWYFGGIIGVGIEAKHYNERLYERLATPYMNKDHLFPVLMLNYAF